VGCTAGSISEGGVDTSTTSIAGRDRAGVVLHGMMLGTCGTGWFLSFALFCVASVALAVVTV
jgi:hypothetical protein